MTLGKPYIGVTGYTTVEQIDAVHRAVGPCDGGRMLMDAVLIRSHDVNKRWANDHVSAPVDFAKRSMAVDEMQRLFAVPSEGSLRMIHLLTVTPTRLDEQLADCIEQFGVHIDGFQINWLAQPSPAELADFRSAFDAQRSAAGLSPSTLILQLHPQVLEMPVNLLVSSNMSSLTSTLTRFLTSSMTRAAVKVSPLILSRQLPWRTNCGEPSRN